MENEPSVGEFREAHKLNYLIDQGEVTTSEVSEADAAEVQSMVEELFNPNYSQNIYKPEMMHEKTGGQLVEDAVVDILNETQHLFHAEHAPEEVDQGKDKADLILHVEGEEEPILVQLTTKTDPSVKKKFDRLPERTIPVIVPSVSRVFDAIKRNNPVDLRGISMEVIGQVLTQMGTRKSYKDLFGRVSARLTTVH